VAIAPLLIRIRTAGAAALGRTAAQLRAFAAAVRAAAARAAAAARTTSTYTAVLRRLGTALRAAALAAMFAARVIGGQLQRALRAAARAAGDLLTALVRMAARFATIRTPIIAVAAALLPVIGNLLGAVTLLAPTIVAVAAAFGTWKLATRGFGDALKADDAEALAEALKKLTPSAQSAALTLRDLGREWKFTQQAVQEKFFAGARDDFIAMSRALQHVAHTWLPKIATAFANARHALRFVIDDAFKSGQLDRIMKGVNDFLSGLLMSIPTFFKAFLNIAEAVAPQFGKLGDSIADTATRFEEWTRKVAADGTLQRWVEKAKQTWGQLKDIGAELGRVFAAIFKGADGEGFLEKLKNSIAAFADWLESENGQNVIKFFSDVAGAIAGVISWIEKAVGFMRRGWDNFREATEGLRNAVVLAFGAIGGAGTALFAIISGGVNAFGWIGGIVSRLGGLVGAVRGAVSAINAALSAIRTTVFIDIITRRFEGSKGYAKGIGGGSGGGGGLKYYAKGGPVAKGQPIVVGDGGRPELFVPDSAGRILPRVPSGGTAFGGGPVSVALSIAPAAGHGANPLVAVVIGLFRDRKIILRDSSGRPVRLAGA
jgi:hypothetical protein